MRATTRLVSTAGIAAGVAAAAVGLTAGPAAASPGQTAAVFVQTDNPSGNSVVAYDRAADGKLNPAGTYPTGGQGGILNGSVVDHLASQGSLTFDRAHGLLYAVNAGSNTLTVFRVRGDRLTRVQVIDSGGAFPVSVAVHGRLVYVLNARGGGSIQGYLSVGDRLVRVAAWHRSLGLDPAAAPEFTHTPGQIAFTPDGGKLVVTTKAGGNSIVVFPVDRLGAPSTKPVVTTDSGAVPFAVAFDAAGHLIVAEAGPNAAATFTIGRDGSLANIARASTGQAATCWIVGADGRFYVSNAGSGSLSGFRNPGDGSLTMLGNTSTGPGTVDAAITADGRYLYVQTGANGAVDCFRINHDGSLTAVGSVTVPGAIGGEGIVAG